ncbi:MAG: hypothetical protein VB027_06655 [Gordonibacter sp.]|nr:hypothetical protein [Gordonibacter sp.]
MNDLEDLPHRLLGIPITSNRCIVQFSGDMVRKIYKSSISFEAETIAYKRLSDKSFVPKVLSINEQFSYIDLEFIDAPTIFEYSVREGCIPRDFAINLYRIELSLAKLGLNSNPDLLKADHIFLDVPSKSPFTNGLRIIDFDVVFPVPEKSIRRNEWIQEQVDSVEDRYRFLKVDDANSREKFIGEVYGLVGDVAYDFEKHMEVFSEDSP